VNLRKKYYTIKENGNGVSRRIMELKKRFSNNRKKKIIV